MRLCDRARLEIMDPPRDSPTMQAPGRTSTSYGGEMRSAPAFGATVEAPAPCDRDLPPVDEHLATPETPEEYFHGELRLKWPSKPPHAIQQYRLAYVLGGHVAEDYEGAVEMLTRTGHDTDFAPDASVFPKAPDEKTGGRQLEELAFEICSSQSTGAAGKKAEDLVGRGVRRVFCIALGGPGQKRLKSFVAEWSRQTRTWSPIPDDGVIEDECLATPMPVKALLDATEGDDAVVHALMARGNRAIREIQEKAQAKGKAEGETEGEVRGRIEERAAIVVSLLEERGVALTEEARQRILGCRDMALLTTWTRQALSVDSIDDLSMYR